MNNSGNTQPDSPEDILADLHTERCAFKRFTARNSDDIVAATHYCEKYRREALAKLNEYYTNKFLEVEKAYGGCHNCYGKGYATVNDRWHGYDTDTDIGSPGGYVSGGNANAMKFCTCGRGKQLEQAIKQLSKNSAPLNKGKGEI